MLRFYAHTRIQTHKHTKDRSDSFKIFGATWLKPKTVPFFSVDVAGSTRNRFRTRGFIYWKMNRFNASFDLPFPNLNNILFLFLLLNTDFDVSLWKSSPFFFIIRKIRRSKQHLTKKLDSGFFPYFIFNKWIIKKNMNRNQNFM